MDYLMANTRKALLSGFFILAALMLCSVDVSDRNINDRTSVKSKTVKLLCHKWHLDWVTFEKEGVPQKNKSRAVLEFKKDKTWKSTLIDLIPNAQFIYEGSWKLNKKTQTIEMTVLSEGFEGDQNPALGGMYETEIVEITEYKLILRSFDEEFDDYLITEYMKIWP
jgi:hypothetical protein